MNNNKFIKYLGRRISLKEVARLNDLNYQTLWEKYKEIGNIYEAVEIVKKVQYGPRKRVDFFGQKMTINEIAKIYNINPETLNNVHKLISNIDEAVSICVNNYEDPQFYAKLKQQMKMQKNIVSIDKLTNLDKNAFPETSLKGNDHTLLNNSIDSNEVAENNLLADDLNKVMKTIPSRESKVLRMRYGFDGNPLIYEEIGKKIGVSKNRAREIEAKALRRLRNKERSKYLVDYQQEL